MVVRLLLPSFLPPLFYPPLFYPPLFYPPPFEYMLILKRNAVLSVNPRCNPILYTAHVRVALLLELHQLFAGRSWKQRICKGSVELFAMSEKLIIIFKYPIHLLELALDWAMLYIFGLAYQLKLQIISNQKV